jgi:hypothetical protein
MVIVYLYLVIQDVIVEDYLTTWVDIMEHAKLELCKVQNTPLPNSTLLKYNQEKIF